MCSIQSAAIVPEFDVTGKIDSFEKAMCLPDESWIDSYLESPGIMTTVDGRKRFITAKHYALIMCPFGFAIYFEKYGVAKKILDKYPELAHNRHDDIDKPLDIFLSSRGLSAINPSQTEWSDNVKSLFTFICNNHFYSSQLFCGVFVEAE